MVGLAVVGIYTLVVLGLSLINSWAGVLLILAACLAPMLATVVLLGARERLLQRTRHAAGTAGAFDGAVVEP